MLGRIKGEIEKIIAEADMRLNEEETGRIKEMCREALTAKAWTRI